MDSLHKKVFSCHADVIKWEHFPRHWRFVRGIHRSTVNSLHKGQWSGALVFSLICGLNKRLSKRSWGWWFQTPSRSLWRHCNVKSVSITSPHYVVCDVSMRSIITEFPQVHINYVWHIVPPQYSEYQYCSADGHMIHLINAPITLFVKWGWELPGNEAYH